MSTILEELFRHHLWANQRLFDLCAGLPNETLDTSAPGTYGTVRDTLYHLASSEERYVALLTDEQPRQPLHPDEDLPGVLTLADHAFRTGERLIALASQVDPTKVLTGTRQGRPYAMSIAVPMVQAINHGTEHRAHVIAILSQNGVACPDLDAWSYATEKGLITTP